MGFGMSDIEVQRWRRYGHDRLYVDDAHGRRLGWCDLHGREDCLRSGRQSVQYAGESALSVGS
ncbi:hypothetical protein ER308_04435 [Egibacter rhizosphaerae]|uniref:Uncharacterized protein n=1 Tax=Egibacter rhizosphaerae TaxID=1670831 RepID=A0A411YCC1_9ACTN|nr:hypothetical protein [Egibacter rhizosphaerae]QBI18864.1 hypothetical protein ER308_04435 [Egibacter rhizosphaerae]